WPGIRLSADLGCVLACGPGSVAASRNSRPRAPVTCRSFTKLLFGEPFALFASSRLIRAQFPRKDAKCAKGIAKVCSVRLRFSVGRAQDSRWCSKRRSRASLFASARRRENDFISDSGMGLKSFTQDAF